MASTFLSQYSHGMTHLYSNKNISHSRIIVDKIDSDKDGFITLVELKDWIRFTQKRYIDEDVERHWRQYNVENEEAISWEVG